MKSWAQTISDSLTIAIGSFSKNELAYLALTSKVEHAVRDRLAFQLHKTVEDQFLVAREWKRIDLAILTSDGRPSCLVELKAAYTFEALEDRPWFLAPVETDLIKIGKFGLPTNDIFSIVLGTHVHGSVPTINKNVVKYARVINRAFEGNESSSALGGKASQVMARLFANRILHQNNMSAGSAFGLEVTIHWWLIRSTNGTP